MKKKFLYATIAAVSLTAGLYLSQSEKKSNLSDLLTENVEALAVQECDATVGGSCWWIDEYFTRCCEGGYYGCKPCE